MTFLSRLFRFKISESKSGIWKRQWQVDFLVVQNRTGPVKRGLGHFRHGDVLLTNLIGQFSHHFRNL